MPHIVSLEKCNSYNQNEVDASLKKLLSNLVNISKFIKQPAKIQDFRGHKNSMNFCWSQKVLIKPNIVKGMKPEECGTTHPIIIESMIKILKEQKCDILVGDNPFADDTIEAMKICGIYDVCKTHNVEIAVFNEKTNKRYENGLVVREFQLTNYFDDVDAIINIPKLKTHSRLYFTGAVKNLYSMMPGPRRGFYHLKYSNMEYFANMLLDLYALLRRKVVLNVIDGVYGMEGNGPCNGNPKFAGILAASSDAVALDFVMCNLAGLDVDNISTIYYAKKRKDYLFNTNNIKIIGENIKNFKIEPFAEAEHHTLNMMPKFVNNFKDYITRHKSELVY